MFFQIWLGLVLVWCVLCCLAYLLLLLYYFWR